MVTLPTSGTMSTNIIYKSCVVKIAGRMLEVDLILLNIKDFDIILGMDWLVAYYTNVDCFNKKVVFKIPNEEPFAM